MNLNVAPKIFVPRLGT